MAQGLELALKVVFFLCLIVYRRAKADDCLALLFLLIVVVVVLRYAGESPPLILFVVVIVRFVISLVFLLGQGPLLLKFVCFDVLLDIVPNGSWSSTDQCSYFKTC